MIEVSSVGSACDTRARERVCVCVAAGMCASWSLRCMKLIPFAFPYFAASSIRAYYEFIVMKFPAGTVIRCGTAVSVIRYPCYGTPPVEER